MGAVGRGILIPPARCTRMADDEYPGLPLRCIPVCICQGFAPGLPPRSQLLWMCRMFDRVAKLKQDYTDKYVVVDGTQPELARFKGITGQVKTVNMSGRALVQFDAWANIGWYDIDVDYLTVISEPLPKPEAKKEAPAEKKAPPAAKGKAPPAAKAAAPAAAKPAAKPAAAKPTGKPSTADILAALRAGKSAATPAAASSEASAAPAPAAKPPAPKPPAAKSPAGAKLSTAEILAAARAKKDAAAAQAAAPPAAEPDLAEVDTPEPEAAEVEPASIDEATVAEHSSAAAARKSAAGPLPTTVAEKIAWCREHDAK